MSERGNQESAVRRSAIPAHRVRRYWSAVSLVVHRFREMPLWFAVIAGASLVIGPLGMCSGILGRMLVEGPPPETASTLGGRAVLFGDGALTLALGILIVLRHRFGLQLFILCSIVSVGLYMVWHGRDVGEWQPCALLTPGVFFTFLCVYAWLNRRWFRGVAPPSH